MYYTSNNVIMLLTGQFYFDSTIFEESDKE